MVTSDRDWIAGVMGEIAQGHAGYLHHKTIEKLARIAEEAILSREGEVVVEGWAYSDVGRGDVAWTAGGYLRVSEHEGMGRIPVTVRISRREVK